MGNPKRERASRAAENSRRAKYKNRRYEDKGNTRAQTVIGDLRMCWCGQPRGHDYPGKINDWPHPDPEAHQSPPALGHDHFYVEDDDVFALFAHRHFGTPLTRTCIICGKSEKISP